MYIDLTSPSRAVAIGTGFTDVIYALTEDNQWAEVIPEDTTSSLVVNRFEEGLPVDAVIDGIQIFAYAQAAGTGSVLSFGLTKDGTNFWGTTLNSNTLTGTASSLVLGTPTYLWGLTSIPASNIRGNSNFGVKIKQASGDGAQIDWVRVRVWFTSNTTYLTGSRSKFPVELDEEYIPTALNGTSPDQQVRSEAANLLGDCLYNVERVALHESNDLSLIGPPGKGGLVLSLMVSGSAASGSPFLRWERTLNISRGRVLVDREPTEGIDPIETLKYTNKPLWNGTFNFVSAVGWVYGTNNLTPLHISPKAYMIRSDSIYDSIFIGFTAVKLAEPAVMQPYHNDNYKGVGLGFSPLTGAGDFVVKMVAIGE